MIIRSIFIGAAGIIALQLLAVRATPVAPSGPPPGWSISDSIGAQYQLGYDDRAASYFIESIGKIEPAGRVVNAKTAPTVGDHRVPYSSSGLKASDLWAASLLQSVKAEPYRNHKVRFEAEVNSSGFKGQLYLMLRAAEPKQGWATTTMTTHTAGSLVWNVTTPASYSGEVRLEDWHTVAAEIDDVPDYSVDAGDDSTLSFGFLLQGEGRVLMRDAKLTSAEITPAAPPSGTHLQDMFADPPAEAQPVNLELRP